MPNTSSAKKADRKSKKQRLLNRSRMSALRTAVKRARFAIQAFSPDMHQAMRLADKLLDQSAAKKLIHKNTAARTKSKLAKLKQRCEAGSRGTATEQGDSVDQLHGREASKVAARNREIKLQGVTMTTGSLRPVRIRLWNDIRDRRRIASVAYDDRSKVFTTQWLTSLAFDRVTEVLDDLHRDINGLDRGSGQGGQLIVGSSDLESQSDSDELPYEVFAMGPDQTARSLIEEQPQIRWDGIRSLSLEVPGFAISFSKEPIPQLLTANVLSDPRQSIDPVLVKSLLLAPCVNAAGDPVDLLPLVQAAMRDLPNELRESFMVPRPETGDEEVVDIE